MVFFSPFLLSLSMKLFDLNCCLNFWLSKSIDGVDCSRWWMTHSQRDAQIQHIAFSIYVHVLLLPISAALITPEVSCEDLWTGGHTGLKWLERLHEFILWLIMIAGSVNQFSASGLDMSISPSCSCQMIFGTN